MKIINLLLKLFERDPYIDETKNNIKQIGKRIASTTDYDELVRLCREYKIIKDELKEYKKNKKSLPNH